MTDKYHNEIINFLESQKKDLENLVGFEILNIRKNIKTQNGEIDIILIGKTEKALIEIKSSPDGAPKFRKKQFKEYRTYDPQASIYLIIGNPNLTLDNFDIQQYWPI